RRFVPPRSTPIEILFMMNDSVVSSREPLSLHFFIVRVSIRQIQIVLITVIFDNLNSSDCCVRPGQRVGSWSCTPGTAPPHGHKLGAGTGRTLLLHWSPRNRK